MTIQFGCVDHQTVTDADGSALSGFSSSGFGKIVTVSPKPRSILGNISKSLLHRSTGKTFATNPTVSTKASLRGALFSEIIAQKGITREQISQVLKEVLDTSGNPCNGVSCAQIFGVRRDQIDEFIDESYTLTLQSRALAEAANTERRAYLIASLQRQYDETFETQLARFMSRDSGQNNASAGTCMISTQSAYPQNSASEKITATLSKVSPNQTIDYRNTSTKNFQGATGACHLFSTLAIFEHSPDPDLENLRNIDIQRSFIDYWADNLGGNIEKALSSEVVYLKEMANFRSQFVEAQIQQGLSESAAHEKWRYRAYPNITMFAQGGYAITNFMRFKTFGVILKDAKIPHLSVNEIESLASEIAQSRMKVIDTLMDKSIPEHEIMEMLRPGLKKIFKIAEDNRHHPRHRAPELDRYTMEKVNFDSSQNPEDIKKFFDTLRKHGPVGISRKGHATSVVAFDAEKHVFYVRDSADRFRMDYTPINEQSMFEHLKAYYVMKRVSFSDD
jgi:hypothetical protein